MIWTKYKEEDTNITIEEIIEEEEGAEEIREEEEETREEEEEEINITKTMVKTNNKDQTINNNKLEKLNHNQFLQLKPCCNNHPFRCKLKNKSNYNSLKLVFQLSIAYKVKKEKTS